MTEPKSKEEIIKFINKFSDLASKWNKTDPQHFVSTKAHIYVLSQPSNTKGQVEKRPFNTLSVRKLA